MCWHCVCPQRISSGFSLVEVMIAAFILMVGISGFATLQSHIMQSEKSLELHAKAVQIGNQKMAELKYFEQIQTSKDKPSYQSIADDQGGNSGAGEIEIIENTLTESSLTYNLHWQVTEQYYVDSDDDGKEDTWVTSKHEKAPSPLPPSADRKTINLQVNWLDKDEEPQQYTLSSYIAPVPLHRSYHAFNSTLDSDLSPKRQIPTDGHNNLVLHSLGTDLVQTSLPLEFDQTEQISKLTTIRYLQDEDSKQGTLEQKTEFAFAQCQCRLSTKGKAKTAAKMTLDAGQLSVKKGQWTNKMTGIAEPEQSPLCSTCCRDHHDTEDMLKEQSYYRKESRSPHTHYKFMADGKYIKANKSGDPYDEVCRFQRVDGEYALLADLHSLHTISFLKPQMTKEFSEEYQMHVSNLLKNYVLGEDLPVSPLENKVTLAPSATQLELRSLYLEKLTEEHKVTLQHMILKGDSGWLKLTPFLDVELTMHADWNSGDKAVAQISNQPRETTFSPKDQLYASYSKGRLVALAAGNTKLTNTLNMGNEGLIGSPAISVFNQSQIISSNPIQLRVTDINLPSLVVDIYCVSALADVKQPCSDTQLQELSKLKIIPEKEIFNCSIEILVQPNTSFFSCTKLPKAWRGTISVDSSLLTEKLNLFWKDPSGHITPGSHLRVTKPISETSNSAYWLIVEFSH